MALNSKIMPVSARAASSRASWSHAPVASDTRIDVTKEYEAAQKLRTPSKEAKEATWTALVPELDCALPAQTAPRPQTSAALGEGTQASQMPLPGTLEEASTPKAYESEPTAPSAGESSSSTAAGQANLQVDGLPTMSTAAGALHAVQPPQANASSPLPPAAPPPALPNWSSEVSNSGVAIAPAPGATAAAPPANASGLPLSAGSHPAKGPYAGRGHFPSQSENSAVGNPAPQRASQDFDLASTWQSKHGIEPIDRAPSPGSDKIEKGGTMSHELRGSSASSAEQMYFKFEVLPSWRREHKQLAATLGCPHTLRAGSKRNKSLIRKATLHQPEADLDSEDGNAYSKKRPCEKIMRTCLSCVRHIIIHPNHPIRGVWDMWSLCLVVWDMISIPLELFDPPENLFSLTMSWVCRIFLTGFLLPDGIIEMRPLKIVRRYFFGWFPMDIFLVLLDWLEIMWGRDNALGYARAGKTSRTLRIIRMFRLLRLARMKEVVRLITERIQSERLTIVADITQIVVIIVGMAHLVACIWYGIGNQEVEGHWVQDLGFEREPLPYRYMTSLHWSLSQFSGGMDEIRPHNTAERLYAVCVFLLAFVMAAVFVSSLTSSMTRLHIIASHQSRQLSVLRRYLSQNGISDRLAMRVQRNAQHAISEQQRLMPEHSVDLLAVVSEPLRVELHFEMHSPLLSVHPFFLRYCDECPQVMKKVCHVCMSMLLVSTGDVIFSAGEIPSQPKMYIICSGILEYLPIVGTVTSCQQGMWLSEATIWTPWMHRGVFRAMDDCRICCLDAAYVQEIASSFDHPDFDPKVYAEEFVKVLNSHSGETTDLPGVELEAIKILSTTAYTGQNWWLRTSPFHGGSRAAKNARRASNAKATRSKSIFGRLL